MAHNCHDIQIIVIAVNSCSLYIDGVAKESPGKSLQAPRNGPQQPIKMKVTRRAKTRKRNTQHEQVFLYCWYFSPVCFYSTLSICWFHFLLLYHRIFQM